MLRRRFNGFLIAALVFTAVGCVSGDQESGAKDGLSVGEIWTTIIAPEPALRFQLASAAGSAPRGSDANQFRLTPAERFLEAALVLSLADDDVATMEEIQRNIDALDAEQRNRLVAVLRRSYEDRSGRSLAGTSATIQDSTGGLNSISARCDDARVCLDQAARTRLFDAPVAVRMSEERRGSWFGPPSTRPIPIVDGLAATNPALSLTLPYPSARESAVNLPLLRMPPPGSRLEQLDGRVHELIGSAGFPNHADYAGEQSRMIYVAQAERIDREDATPLPGTRRWSEEPLACRWRTVWDWFGCVFGGNYTEVHMRIFVFAFADRMVFTEPSPGDARALMNMGRFGPRSAPPTGPSPPGHEMHVLVYEVVGEGGAQQNDRGMLTPEFRLRRGTRPVEEHLRLGRLMEDVQ